MPMNKPSKDCALVIHDGKVWCEYHHAFHEGSFRAVDWKRHRRKGCNLVYVKFRHILYVAQVCTKHSVLLLDEEL
jgi:hypothetical protein